MNKVWVGWLKALDEQYEKFYARRNLKLLVLNYDVL
jgi:hypothetical protein